MRNTAELEGLVVGPYRWSSETHYSFLQDAYTVISAEMDRLRKIEVNGKQTIAAQALADSEKKKDKIDKLVHEAADLENNFDSKVAQFVQDLIRDSDRVLGNANWVDIIDIGLWNLLKLDENGRDRYKLDDDMDVKVGLKKKSIAHLFKLIRDKIAHVKTYKNNMKEKLSQFFDKADKDQYHFNKNRFVAFWISKFPKLMPYLWVKFYSFKENLSNYYPDDEIETGRFQDSLLDLNKFTEAFHSALFADVENGNVLKRFKGDKCSLEFRGYHSKIKIKDTNVFMKFAGNSKDIVSLSVSNSFTSKDKLEYVGTSPGTENFILIFVDDIEDDAIWKYCINCDCRVIVFCHPQKLGLKLIENFVDKFRNSSVFGFDLTESPIRGSELSKERQEWVYNQGKVSIQDRDIKLKDIFRDSSTMAGALVGKFMNELLKCTKVILFAAYKYPEHKPVYVDRQLLLIDQSANYAKLEHIYVAINYSKTDLEMHSRLMNPVAIPAIGIDSSSETLHSSKVFKKSITSKLLYLLEKSNKRDFLMQRAFDSIQQFTNVSHLFDERDAVQSDCEFIILEEPTQFSDEIIEKCEAVFCSRAVRFLDKMFKKTDNSRVHKRALTFGESRRLLSEKEFLRVIRSKSIKTFFFLSESGMGKTKLLTSLGKKLENSLVIYFTFRHFVDSIREKVGNKECIKADLKHVVLETLKCKSESERNVIEYWLERKGDSGAKVEVQLDGLDEVHGKNLNFALKVINMFEEQFDSVRLWITSSKPYPSERSREGFAVCSISPLTKDDNVNFFKLYLSKKYPELDEIDINNYVQTFLQNVEYSSYIKMPEGLLSYPLNCSMLAELYDDKITDQNNFKVIPSGLDLYESLIKQKFAFMFRKKIGTKLDENDNDFKFQREIYFQIHVHLALVHLFPKVSNEFTKPLAMKFLTDENFCKMGIITSSKPVNFIHISYADFFIARYIIKVLKTKELDYLCSKKTFDTIFCFGTAEKSDESIRPTIWKVLDDYLGRCRGRDWSSLKWLDTHNKQQHCYVNENKVYTFLTSAIENHFWVLAKLLINVWVNENDKTICNKILHRAIISDPPINWFISMCEQLSFDNLYNLIICAVQNENYEIAKYLIEKWCGNDVFDKIAETRETGGGIFHYIAERIANQHAMIEPDDFMEGTKKFIIYLHGKNRDEIERNNNRGQTFLQALPVVHLRNEFGFSNKHIISLKKFVSEDLDAEVEKFKISGESVLNYENANGWDFSYKCHKLWVLKKSLERYHKQLIILSSDAKLMEKANALMDSKLDEDYGLEILSLDVNLDGTFMNAKKEMDWFVVKIWDDIEIVELLVEFGYQLDVQNKDGLCALCVAEKLGKVEAHTFFREKMQLKEGQTCKLNCIKKVQQG